LPVFASADEATKPSEANDNAIPSNFFMFSPSPKKNKGRASPWRIHHAKQESLTYYSRRRLRVRGYRYFFMS
jgi:hypothetical protein